MAEVTRRDEAFGYANRMDEKYDFVRSLRKGKFHYMRCFEPWLPDGLHNNYRYKMLAYEEWRELWKAGKLSGAPAQFFAPKPVEMLFDCEADPWNAKNLATDPAYAATLADLRSRLQARMRAMPDLSYYPESYLATHAMDNPAAFGQKNRAEIGELANIADLILKPYTEAKTGISTALASTNPMQRYWGAMVCTAFGRAAAEQADRVKALVQDESPAVQVRALEFLGSIGAVSPQPALTKFINTTQDTVLAVEALNSVVWFRDHFDGKYPVARADFHPTQTGGDIDDRLNYLNGVPYPNEGQGKGKGKRKGKKKP
jgi:uncharacterized sulfatase